MVVIEIVNVNQDWAIGKRGQLLVHIPADMRFFRETTAGKVCIMGSTTLESFPRMAPLRNRVNIVLIDDEKKIRPESLQGLAADRAAGYSTELRYVYSRNEALATAAPYPKDDVFVIGGASVYRLMLPYCDTCLVTHNDYPSDGADTYFPNLNAAGEWRMTDAGAPQTYEGTTFRFCRYERIGGGA